MTHKNHKRGADVGSFFTKGRAREDEFSFLEKKPIEIPNSIGEAPRESRSRNPSRCSCGHWLTSGSILRERCDECGRALPN